MSGLPSDDRPAVGLRERKKAKTRAAIQLHALRLFRERGYHATTVEQIAEAAEISPSTFFRYFPTKEAVVLTDDYDPVLLAAFHAQPAELTPLQAVRGAMTSVLAGLPAAELAATRERTQLVMAVPELRAGTLQNMTETTRLLAVAVAERVGRDPDDVAVRTFTGALLGVWTTVLFRWVEDPGMDLLASLDEAMALLEAGLPL
jgi:AcrR family transcriptional regulator